MSSAIHRQTIFREASCVKRAAGGLWLVFLLLALVFGEGIAGAVTPGGVIFEADLSGFSEEDYRGAVEEILRKFERERGEAVRPGRSGKVGLKISTVSGPGLSTPKGLVAAVAESLMARGFAAEDIFLIDQTEIRMRRAGFLPPFGSEERDFRGHPVYVLESGDYYDPDWYYESPLPPRRGNVTISHDEGGFRYADDPEGRRSYLPVPLMLGVDFWINLPVYTDHPVLGVNGALLNATIWNAGNSSRFGQSGVNGAAAVAEMAAVPELEENWLFSIVSLELYQFAGGPPFRSLYTESEPRLLLSADPVALDSRLYRRMNEARERQNLPPLAGGERLLEYAQQLNLGVWEEKRE